MNRLAYFPGCWLTTTTRGFDISTRAVANKLGWELIDFDWNCCGDFSVHLTDPMMGMALAARNLAAAERLEADLVTPCAGCFRYQEETRLRLAADPELLERVEGLIKGKVTGTARCLPLLVVLDKERTALRSRICRPLSSLKVACYYGCRLTRPAALVKQYEPHLSGALDRLLEAAGATPVSWSHGDQCCGAFHSVPRPDVVSTRVALIRASADEAGAEVIVTSCPWCYRNLAFYQQAPELPVFHFTQLLGLALGCPPAEVGLPSEWLCEPIARILKDGK